MRIAARQITRMLSDPIGWLRESLANPAYGLERFCGRFYGTYAGKVVDNNDPKGVGRIKAICPAINVINEDDIGDADWIYPCLPSGGVDPETKQMTGMFYPPDVGANVWIQFENGDKNHPIYIGGWFPTTNESDTFNSALKKGIRTKTGHFIRMSDDPEDLHLIVTKGDGSGGPSPTFLSMSKEGHTTLTNDLGSLLYMNGEKPEVSLMAANEDGEVTSLLMLGDDKITLATKSGGAIGISGKDITTNGDNFIANCGKQFNANAGTVMLGKDAKDPAVRGMKLMQWGLIHQHVSTAPGSPTTTGPTPPLSMFNELSEKVFIG